MTESEYLPSAGAHEEGELPPSGGVVRYKGSANERRVSLRDLQGRPDTEPEVAYLTWISPERTVDWEDFVAACGSEERAAEFLAANSFEFSAENVNIELPEEEEFNIGGSVE